MTKIIEIENCKVCPAYLPFTLCTNPDLKVPRKLDIKKFGKIPSWCPLKDKEVKK